LGQFQDGTLKITNAKVTFITALTKNGISGDLTNIDSIFSLSETATGANTTPFTTGTWVKNL
jgi:hypothetical protein